MVGHNIWPKSAALREIRLRNFSDHDFGLSRSLKVTGLPVYSFLLMFNRNIWPNSAPFQDIML